VPSCATGAGGVEGSGGGAGSGSGAGVGASGSGSGAGGGSGCGGGSGSGSGSGEAGGRSGAGGATATGSGIPRGGSGAGAGSFSTGGGTVAGTSVSRMTDEVTRPRQVSHSINQAMKSAPSMTGGTTHQATSSSHSPTATRAMKTMSATRRRSDSGSGTR
jgi:hypothetical protein